MIKRRHLPHLQGLCYHGRVGVDQIFTMTLWVGVITQKPSREWHIGVLLPWYSRGDTAVSKIKSTIGAILFDILSKVGYH